MKKQFKIIFQKELKTVTRSASSLFLSIIMPLILLPVFLTLLIRNSSSLGLEDKINNPRIALYIDDDNKKINITEDDKKGYEDQFIFINDSIFKEIHPKYEKTDNEIEAFSTEKIDVSITFGKDLLSTIYSNKTKVVILFNDANNTSYSCAAKIMELINVYSTAINEVRLQSLSISIDDINGVDVNLTTYQEEFKEKKLEGLNDSFLNMLVPTFISIFLAFGSVAVISEMFIVEKEKNTLESLFSTGTNRNTILISKMAVSFLFSFISLLMEFLGFLSAILFNLNYFSSVPIYFKPSSIFFITLTLLSVSLLLSIISTTIFIFAKNNRNAMALLAIVQFIPVVISMVLIFVSNSIMNHLGFMFIPIIGSLFSFKLSIQGYVNPTFLIVSFAVNLIVSIFLIFISFKRYKSEKVLLNE